LRRDYGVVAQGLGVHVPGWCVDDGETAYRLRAFGLDLAELPLEFGHELRLIGSTVDVLCAEFLGAEFSLARCGGIDDDTSSMRAESPTRNTDRPTGMSQGCHRATLVDVHRRVHTPPPLEALCL
jgi:hypothetical protein